MDLQENKPLAPLTTIGIGGPARYFLTAKSEKDVLEGLRWAEASRWPVFFLGGGSNLLFADEGWPGLVIDLAMMGVQHGCEDGLVSLHAQAGENWDGLVALAVSRNWAGIECLSGIPGRVGATPIQNVGAYGQEVGETIQWVKVLDLETFRIKKLSARECRFTYRSSIFKTGARNKYLILSVNFHLIENGEAAVRYPGLAKRLPENPSLAQVRQAVLEVRRDKAMVVAPNEPNSRSCGSFFTNPILSESQYATFKRIVDGPHPSYGAGEGKVKLPAAWLIEQAGFQKGYCHRNVGLSQKHSLAIINRGGGTAVQVYELVAMIRKAVAQKFGVVLWPEPVLLTATGKPMVLPGNP